MRGGGKKDHRKREWKKTVFSRKTQREKNLAVKRGIEKNILLQNGEKRQKPLGNGPSSIEE